MNMTTTIEKQLVIHATPERTFRALAEKEELERWFVQKAEGDMRPGGAMKFEWAPDMVEKGQILEIDPPHRLSYMWEAFSHSPVTIIFELSVADDSTRLHFNQMGMGEGENWGNYITGMSHGWDIHLDHLTAWLETGSCPPAGPTKSL